jgi:hypothetical protein
MKDENGFEEMSDSQKFKTLYAKSKRKQPKDPNTPYLMATVISLLIGIVGVVMVVTLRPDFDILVVAGVIFAFLTPTTTSLLALMKTQETNEQAKETHLSVNSRLDAFIVSASNAARAEGVKEGEKAANLRTDELAKRQ